MMRWLTIPILWALCAGAQAETLSGRVVAISDGDTITILDAHNRKRKARLAGIEAPKNTQPQGDRSKQHLSDLVYGKSVEVEWRTDDANRRIFGKVTVAAPDACPAGQRDCPKKLDVGLAQIVAGLAWQYRHFEEEQIPQDRAAYAFAENVARRKHAGLWADTAPVPPWQWHGEEKKPR
jgi:endonuclease YncB( thermonuclease family)